MRSEFQIMERSLIDKSSKPDATISIFLHPSASVFFERKTAASSCMTICIFFRNSAVDVFPFACLNLSNLSIAWSHECVFKGLFELVLSTTSLALIAAALPKTTKSIKLLDPNLLAPWTEAHPASPTAIKPGWTKSSILALSEIPGRRSAKVFSGKWSRCKWMWSPFSPTPRPSFISIVMHLETTSLLAKSL